MEKDEKKSLLLRIESLLSEFLSDEFNHTSDEIENNPYSVLSNAIEYMYAKNMLKKGDQDSKYFLSKIEIFQGINFSELDKDRVEDFIIDLKNYLGECGENNEKNN